MQIPASVITTSSATLTVNGRQLRDVPLSSWSHFRPMLGDRMAATLSTTVGQYADRDTEAHIVVTVRDTVVVDQVFRHPAGASRWTRHDTLNGETLPDYPGWGRLDPHLPDLDHSR